MGWIRSIAVGWILVALFTSMGWADIAVVYTVDTEAQRNAISPYIYGINWATGSWFTLRRCGGNRLTGYNWENNFSNAGSDWYHSSDRYLVRDLPASQQCTPGKHLTSFHDTSLTYGQVSILTLPMAGYVAADDAGTVSIDQTAPSFRWKQVVYAKGAPFCDPRGGPDTSDDTVYVDECVNFLVKRYGGAAAARGVSFYSLDNEPALWSYTHPRIHPTPTGCAELCDRSIELASAVKAVDPNAQILGPALYGMNAFVCLQDSGDWNSIKRNYTWFIDYYLDRMQSAESAGGKRLLGVLDVHWYPEAQDVNGVRITQSLSHYYRANAEARMQAPRSLWDPEYHEKSWIEQWLGQYLPVLPPLLNSISRYYPGTRLAITEYDYGAGDHYSGGIAIADVLGIFGKYGLYIGAYWGDAKPYINAAFKLYRDYDGYGSTFGDTSVCAATSDEYDSSIYASVFDANDSTLHLIVLNKSFDEPIAGEFDVSAPQVFTHGRVWSFDSTSPTIVEGAPIELITANRFSYTIPPLTACHIILETDDVPIEN
jgi:hypothetical protein